MVFPLRDHFFSKNGPLDWKIRQMVKKSSKYIENKCSHWAFWPIWIGKPAHRKGNIKHVWTWSQAISSDVSCLFTTKIAKIAKVKCTHRSTNPFDASIFTIARLLSLCGKPLQSADKSILNNKKKKENNNRQLFCHLLPHGKRDKTKWQNNRYNI